MQFVPEWVAIIGSGYIGLEFSDVYTALGSEVTFIEALPNLMPTFDKEIAKQAERLLIRERPIDYRTGVFAAEVTPGIPGEKPVTIKMIAPSGRSLISLTKSELRNIIRNTMVFLWSCKVWLMICFKSFISTAWTHQHEI